MPDKYMNCGCKESQVIAGAKTLGLLEEFEAGLYTCCQISQWADEQCLAWFEALAQDGKLPDDMTTGPELENSDTIFVPVHLRRKQVPWYRSPEGLR